MSPSLSASVRSALRDLQSAARNLGDPKLAPPTRLSDDEEVRAWASEHASGFKSARRQHAQELAMAQAQVAAGRMAKGGTSEAAWRSLDEAVAKLEAELTSASSLSARLGEGRRSMTAKAERVVQENLNAVVTVSGGRVEAGLDTTGVSRLRDELPRWVLGWAEYGYRSFEVDLHRSIERLWTRRMGDLPLPPPELPPLELPPAPKPPDFPTITQTADLEGVGGIFKHARSALYGVMSIAFLFGLRSGEYQEMFTMAMPIVALAGLGFGYMQNRSEQATRLERFETDVARKAEQAVKDVLRTWYDRQADKLREHAVVQLHERRLSVVAWYKTEVLPTRRRIQSEAEQRTAAAQAAQGKLGRLQQTQRDHDRAKAALAMLTTR